MASIGAIIPTPEWTEIFTKTMMLYMRHTFVNSSVPKEMNTWHYVARILGFYSSKKHPGRCLHLYDSTAAHLQANNAHFVGGMLGVMMPSACRVHESCLYSLDSFSSMIDQLPQDKHILVCQLKDPSKIHMGIFPMVRRMGLNLIFTSTYEVLQANSPHFSTLKRNVTLESVQVYNKLSAETVKKFAQRMWPSTEAAQKASRNAFTMFVEKQTEPEMIQRFSDYTISMMPSATVMTLKPLGGVGPSNSMFRFNHITGTLSYHDVEGQQVDVNLLARISRKQAPVTAAAAPASASSSASSGSSSSSSSAPVTAPVTAPVAPEVGPMDKNSGLRLIARAASLIQKRPAEEEATLLARSEDRAQSSRESSTFLAKSQADHREAEGSRKSSKVEAEAEEVDEEYVPSPPRKRGRPAKNQSNGSN